MIFDKPYVSFVVAARNDNYGGDFLQRITTFAHNLLGLCDLYGLNSELVIVEWNPPRDRPRLSNALLWPQGWKRQCRVKIIEVPNEVHKKLPSSEKKHLFEYIGKNVGVRRATGEYVLVTNPDLVFSRELIEFLASNKLSPDCFYRVNRYDLQASIPADIPVQSCLDYCAGNFIRVHAYGRSYENKPGEKFNLRKQIGTLKELLKQKILYFPFKPPHTNAAGDFLLMSKHKWNELKGYPELERKGNSHHIDGLLVNICMFSRLRQVVLKDPVRIYHQGHDRDEADKPYSPEVRLALKEMQRKHKPVIVNSDDWGLGGDVLKECLI